MEKALEALQASKAAAEEATRAAEEAAQAAEDAKASAQKAKEDAEAVSATGWCCYICIVLVFFGGVNIFGDVGIFGILWDVVGVVDVINCVGVGGVVIAVFLNVV